MALTGSRSCTLNFPTSSWRRDAAVRSFSVSVKDRISLSAMSVPSWATLETSFTWRTMTWLHLSGTISRSEEHTSELQSHSDLVCRLLLDKKKQIAGDQTLRRIDHRPSTVCSSKK